MGILEDAIRTLEYIGVADVLLPFLLIFVIVYAVLTNTSFLGGDNNKIDIVLAFVAGMAVVFPHVLRPGSAYDIVPIINNALPIIMIGLVAILALALLVGLFSGEKITDWNSTARNIFFLAAIVFVLWTFLASANYVAVPHYLRGFFYNRTLVNTIIAVIVFVVIIGYITGDGDRKLKDENNPLKGPFYFKPPGGGGDS